VKTRLAPILTSLVLAALASSAQADVIIDLADPFTGADSGWSVILADPTHTGVVVDRVTDSYVRIEISKQFVEPPVEGEFAPILIGFHQRLDDANTASVIQITDEVIRNNTGADWTDFHWHVVGAEAAFNRYYTDNSGFSVDPFTHEFWGSQPAGWDANHAASLGVDEGVVPDGGMFTPGLASGRLYIDTDLSAGCSDFVLKEVPTPEPGSLAVVLSGAAFVLIRRRRQL